MTFLLDLFYANASLSINLLGQKTTKELSGFPSQTITCLPHTVEASDCPCLLLKVNQAQCQYQFLYSLV